MNEKQLTLDDVVLQALSGIPAASAILVLKDTILKQSEEINKLKNPKDTIVEKQ